MTIRPAAISALMVRSLRTIEPQSIAGPTRGKPARLRRAPRLKIPRPTADISRIGAMEANRQEKDDQNVKRVDLPSGKTIEVVYYQEKDAPQPGTGPRELHICPGCDSSLA